MKLDQLRRMALFAMVAKEESFTAVAKKQNIATSAVSAAVSQLEEELGVRLLHRTTRTLRLTEAGNAFYKRCEAMLFEANTAQEELHQINNELVGPITIAAAHWEAETWLLPALHPLLRQNPKLIPQLMINDGIANLIEHDIDIAIRSAELTDSSLVARALTPDLQDLLVATPSYLKRHSVPQTAQDLTQHFIVAFNSFAQPQNIRCFDPTGLEHVVRLKLGAKADTMRACIQLCLMHLGMARLPLDAVKNKLNTGDLVQILPAYTMPTYKTYAVTVRRTLQSAKINATLQAFQDFFSKEKPE